MTGSIPPTSGPPPSNPSNGSSDNPDAGMSSSGYTKTYEDLINNPAAEKALDTSIKDAGSQQRDSMKNEAAENKQIEEDS